MIWRLILGGVWKPLLALLALLGIYGKVRADAASRARTKAQEAYIKTREKTDAADLPSNADDARKRMRDRPADRR